MDDSVKARLKAAEQKKRQANPKAKDYAPDEWLILLDQAIDDLVARGRPASVCYPQPGWDEAVSGFVGCTLKYVPDGVVEALAARLHGVKVRYSVGPNRVRETYVLPRPLVERLLAVMRLDVNRYRTWWSVQSIATCRVQG